MTIAILASTNGHFIAQGTSTGATTAGGGEINSTGAKLIVIHVVSLNTEAAPTLSDSKSNTWVDLTIYDGGTGVGRSQLFYCIDPIVGSGHSFTVSGTDSYASLAGEAFSADDEIHFGGETGDAFTVTLVTSGSPGSVTPGAGNLAVTGLSVSGGTSPTINSSFTKTDSADTIGGTSFSNAIAYKVSAGGAEAPTWSWTTTSTWATGIVAFTESPPVPPGSPDAPTSVTGTNQGNSTVLVDWDAPADPGDSAIIQYDVLGTDGFTATVASPATSVLIGSDGLGTVTYTVTATNTEGTGPPSASSAGVSITRSVAATFYIDPAGDDNNTGLSGSPWETTDRFADFAIYAGDNYVLTPGETYDPFTRSDSGGTTGARITFGTGRTLTEFDDDVLAASNPAIIEQTGAGNCIRWSDPPANLCIDNIKALGPGVDPDDGSTISAGCGFSISSSQDTDSITGLRLLALESEGLRDGGPICWIDNNVAHPGFEDLVISKCVSHHCRRNGIIVLNYNLDTETGTFPGSTHRVHNTNVYIRRSVVHHITGGEASAPNGEDGGGGLNIRHTTTGAIEDSIAYEIGVANPTLAVGGTAGIALCQSDGVAIRRCEAHHIYAPQSPVPIDGCAFNIDLDTINCTIEYSYGHHCDGGFALIYNNDSWPSGGGGNVIRYNIGYANRQKAGHEQQGLAIFAGNTDGRVECDVYGNTFVETNGVALCRPVGSAVPTVRAFNNIFWSKSGSAVVDFAPDTLEGNLYYASGGTVTVAGETSLANLRSAGYEVSPHGVFNSNPVLDDVAGASTGSTLPDDPVSSITNFDIDPITSLARADNGKAITSADYAGFSISPGTTDFHGAPNTIEGLFAIGADSGFTPATVITLSGPSSGAISVASGNFNVGVNGDIDTTVVFTPTSSAGTGSFTPTTVSLTAGSPSGTFVYTPTSTGARNINGTNNGGLSAPSNVSYTVTGGGGGTALLLRLMNDSLYAN